MDTVILENLQVRFLEHQVLDGVNIAFQAKGISVLVGRSGSGKTTLLRSINRLNEEFEGCATSGQIYIDFGDGKRAVYPSSDEEGKEKGMELSELRLRVGMLFQTPNLFPVSVFRNIAMPLELVGGCPKKDIAEKVHDALRLVGLWDELKDSLHVAAERISGGQQQRLCLARILALQPSILLLDEPTASLDVHSARHIEDVLLKLAENYTVIMVSHSLAQARRLGDRILVCEQGRISGQINAHDDVSETLLESML